ncbi:hypothetical protein Bca4012_076913 [Brassica carinata]|uniref:Uncharacterized protein n=1 Tax=Brassica oleracea TaxID=3712 RepID=A0A3P6DY50_BRAOL|nr:unnamed protein product [Brassica oleracea]
MEVRPVGKSDNERLRVPRRRGGLVYHIHGHSGDMIRIRILLKQKKFSFLLQSFPNLKTLVWERMVYLIIKELSPSVDKVCSFIVTSSLISDMNSKIDMYLANGTTL